MFGEHFPSVVPLASWPRGRRCWFLNFANAFSQLRSSRSLRYPGPPLVVQPTVSSSVCSNARCRMLMDGCSFAFVEYEDKRDADDAYYEMHNKRLGRDDILKIEVSQLAACSLPGVSKPLTRETVGQNSSFCFLALRVRSRP